MRDKLAPPEFWKQALACQYEDLEAYEKSYRQPPPGP